MSKLRPITKSQYQVSLVAPNGPTLTATFTNFSGVKDSSDSSEHANGSGNRLYKLVGPRSADNVTLSAPYDPLIYKQLENYWLRYNCEYITVTITPVDCRGDGSAPGGGNYTLYECRYVSVTTGEVDRESADPAQIEIELTVNEWERT
jgi:hypothetical protein